MPLTVAVFILSFVAIIAAQECEQVDGVRQSPINIDPSSVIPDVASGLKWSSGYFEVPESLSLINNGYTLKLTPRSKKPLSVSGGLLLVSYELQQIHFHWGDENNKGSEHTIDNHAYPLEMHAVHSQSSVNDTDQFVVVTYFFRLARRANKGLQNILDVALVAAETRNESLPVQPFAPSELLSTSSFAYYTYKGSLTTPPYTESVTWIIASTALPIAESQLETFRRAAELDEGLLNNFRCVQDLNGRVIRFVIPFN